MNKFRILSIDGGGLRGVVPLSILQRIEEMTGKPIWQSFDLIAGTSTGGLIACALTMPKDSTDKNKGSRYKVEDILTVYRERGKEIFPPRKAVPGKVVETIDDTMTPVSPIRVFQK